MLRTGLEKLCREENGQAEKMILHNGSDFLLRNQAAAFADKRKHNAGSENVTLTGHSFGGGLATYASIKTGLQATTVNSAPLALTDLGGNTLSGDVRNNPNITHYYVP